MAGETASDVVNNSLYGDLYQKGNDKASMRYRMGELRLDANPIAWQVFNLTENCYDRIPVAEIDKLHKISKGNLAEQEKKNLERLLKQPRE